jgi:hypothetical protein
VYLLHEHPVPLNEGPGRDEPARLDLRCHKIAISAADVIRGSHFLGGVLLRLLVALNHINYKALEANTSTTE